MPNRSRFLLTAILASVTTFEGLAEEPVVRKNVEFARVDEHRLALDLYAPRDVKRPPLVVWVHGGAWRRGSRDNVPVAGLTKHGFAVASVDYRLSPVARFPAQVHDVKAAIRFLRANAKELGVDAQRITVAGASAGGHLAALVGVTNGHRELEGKVGGHLDVSSDVAGIVSFYGASNLRTILSQSTPHGLGVRVPALELLLGGRPENEPVLAKLASPVSHVDDGDPPLLLLHGDQDPQMPINQSHELIGAYERVERPVTFDVVHGAAHGGDAFYTAERLKRVARFVRESLTSPKP